MALIGTVIRALATAGANRFNSISLQIENPASLLDQARMDAVKDARRKAELLATATGVKLGPLLFISYAQRSQRGGGEIMQMATMSKDATIAEGEVSLTAQAYVIFQVAED